MRIVKRSRRVSLTPTLLLVKAFPPGFRERFGLQISSDARRLLNRELQRRGQWGLFSAALGLFANTLFRLGLEWGREIAPSLTLKGSLKKLMNELIREVRYSVRSLLRNPGFSAVCALTLALAMAANSTIFMLIDQVLLRPLPYQDPGRIVAIWDSNPTGLGLKARVSSFNFIQWKEQSKSFERLALYGSASFDLRTAEEVVRIEGVRITEDYFPVLGVAPQMGRAFLPEEFEANGKPVAMLSPSVWHKHFGGDPGIIGGTVPLNGVAYTVVGIAPRLTLPLRAWHSGRLEFGSDKDYVWTPLAPLNPTHSHIFGVIGKIGEGTTFHQAALEMEALSARLQKDFPSSNRDTSALMLPIREEAVGSVESGLWMLGGAVAFVLIIACTNIANLTLVRAENRRGELALRAALGAGRFRVFLRFWMEGGLLAAAGGVLGLVLSIWWVRLIPLLNPQNIPRLESIGIDLRAVVATFLLCALAGLVFAAVPAWQVNRRHIESDLRSAGRNRSGAHTGWLRQAMIIVQVAVAMTLAIGAGLMIKSFSTLMAVDPGFQAGNVLTMQFVHSSPRYGDMTELNRFYDRLLQEATSLPGVVAAGASYDHPLQSNWTQGFAIVDKPDIGSGPDRTAFFRTVTPGYFETMGLRLRQGRFLNDSDDLQGPGAAVVNESFARRFFQEQGPLGQRLRIRTTQWVWGDVIPQTFEIVGVVADVKFSGLQAESTPAYYLPFRQTPQQQMHFLVRTDGDPMQVLPALRQRIRGVDDSLPVSNVSSIERILFESVSQPRFSMLVLGFFAAGALLLANLGLWGVVSDVVRQRTREIGIRMAIGAERSSILRLVLTQGLQPVLAGVVVGAVGALALNRALAGLLFNTSSTDPSVYAGIGLLLLAVACLACFLPAQRASRLDPGQVLRYD